VSEKLGEAHSAFSDGVFAFATTLLVLDLEVPTGSGGHLLQAVFERWPSYLGYVVSFFTVGSVWMVHTAVNECLERVDSVMLMLNLSVLFFVALLPFPLASSTHTYASHMRSA
jgi:TMEM175 potassium channel family protein